MFSHRTSGVVCGLLALLCPLTAQAALINNGDFSAGFTGWTTSGSTSTGTSYTYNTPSSPDPGFVAGTISPTVGANVAELAADGGGTNANSLETFLGLPKKALRDFESSLTHSYTHRKPNSGSAIQTTFDGSGVLAFDWNFWTEDTPDPNDFAFFTISGPGISGTDIVLLSDVNQSAEALAVVTGTGPGAGTGWQTLQYALPGDGVYTIGFGVVNGKNKHDPSFLYIDNVGLVPEASTSLTAAMAIFAGLSLSRRRRRRRRY